MATTIEVNKQSVKQLLETGKTKKFIIPEYQRAYSWQEEQIQTLFDDLVEYTESKTDSTYFLGSIVSYENDEGHQEIIDGQQRITSLFLLLRALYAKLTSMSDTPESSNFKSQIESALWEQNELTAVVDFDKTLITSRVMGDEGNEIFHNILKTGKVTNLQDNYSKNYSLFADLIEKYATNEPELFYWLIRNILNKAILLPITADSQDTALTIFSTLNDRGLALSDADIFKAKIYNHLSDEEKIGFIEKWQQLDADSLAVGESIQRLFYYYMFYLRASENDRKTTTPGIRKFYSKDNFKQLYSLELMDNLNEIVDLWLVTNNRTIIEDQNWSNNIEIRQSLDILSSYPNEFWKYPVVIYYLKYHQEDDFEKYFLHFLRKLMSILLTRYIVTPTINAVKGGILNLNAEIINSKDPKFDFIPVDEKELVEKIKRSNRNTIRMILKILAYQQQKNLLPEKWEIEHILPQKWQSAYFPSTADIEVKELVEHIGNKVPFEKKLNIIASNGYFAKKKISYNESEIKLVLNLSNSYSDWGIDEIRERDIRISDELFILLKKWGLNDIDKNEKSNYIVAIPLELINNYHSFLKSLNFKDSDENRSQFMDLQQDS